MRGAGAGRIEAVAPAQAGIYGCGLGPNGQTSMDPRLRGDDELSDVSAFLACHLEAVTPAQAGVQGRCVDPGGKRPWLTSAARCGKAPLAFAGMTSDRVATTGGTRVLTEARA